MAPAAQESGSGLSLASRDALPPDRPVQHGEYSQASRALALGSYFLSGLMAINVSQFLGAPLYLVNRDWFNAWLAYTKQSFAILTTTMTQCWAPTLIRTSGDKSMRGQLLKTTDGDLLCNFPERIVLVANHQIYTDWLYLWWVAYTSGMHGRLYIMLKESLRRIPVIGWGMQFYQFIFLKRNWEKDMPNMRKHLQKLNDPAKPMWLLMFPEGTNLAPSTRQKSKKWAQKNGIPDMEHQLLPRSTGLRFCLQELQDTVEYLYDCTIGYEGVPRGEYAQDIFTLKASYLEGRPPKSVSMYWRRFKLSSIPINDADAFDQWLRAHWTAKDKLLEGFVRTGYFPADTGAGRLETHVRAARWYEFMQIFAPVGLLGLILYAFYGALPKRIVKSLKRKSVTQRIETVQEAVAAGPTNLLTAAPKLLANKKLPIGPLIKALAGKGLPIVPAIKTLVEKNLVIGSVPVGLVLKAISDNHLPVSTMQSLLRVLTENKLLKGQLPAAPEKRLLKAPGQAAPQQRKVTPAKKPVASRVASQKPIAKAPSTQSPLVKTATTAKPVTSQPLATPKKPASTAGSVSTQTSASSRNAPSTATSISAKSAVAPSKPTSVKSVPTATTSGAAQKPAVTAKTIASQKQPTAQKAVAQKPTPPNQQTATAPKPAPAAKTAVPQKSAAVKQPTAVVKVTTVSKPAPATKPVAGPPKLAPSAKVAPKTATAPKAPLKEVSNPKAPAKPASVSGAAANAPKKLPAQTSKTSAAKPGATPAPKKLDVKPKSAANPPKLATKSETAKPTVVGSAKKTPALPKKG